MFIAKKHILIFIFYMTIAYIFLNFELHNHLKKFEHSGLDDESDIEIDIANHHEEKRILILKEKTLQIQIFNETREIVRERKTTNVLLAKSYDRLQENSTFIGNTSTNIIEKIEFCIPLIYKYFYTSKFIFIQLKNTIHIINISKCLP